MKLDNTLPKTIGNAAKKYDKKNPNRIASIEDERQFETSGTAYWIYTMPGWRFDFSCHTETAQNVSDVINAIKKIKPCFCQDCQQGIGFEG